MEHEIGLSLMLPMLVAEPVAAVIAYGLGRQTEESLVLVVDLGGGTYDISLVECFEGNVISLGSANSRLHARGKLGRRYAHGCWKSLVWIQMPQEAEPLTKDA